MTTEIKTVAMAQDGAVAVVMAPDGDIYFSEYTNTMIQRWDAQTDTIHPVAGTGVAGYSGDGGQAVDAQIGLIQGLALDDAGNLYMADYFNNRVRRVDAVTGVITTVAGNDTAGLDGDGGLAVDANLYQPTGLAFDSNGDLYIYDHIRIRRVDLNSGIIETVAGNLTGPAYAGQAGIATEFSFSAGVGLAFDSQDNLYFAPTASQRSSRIVRVDAQTQQVTTILGRDGFSVIFGEGGPAVLSNIPTLRTLTFDPDDNLFISNFSSFIWRVDKEKGVLTRVAGGGDVPIIGETIQSAADVAVDQQRRPCCN